jgi:hypothetical protein
VNTRMQSYTIALLMVVALLPGCSFATFTPVQGASVDTATDAASVQILAETPTDRPFLVLGLVSADSPTLASAVAKLRAEAAKVGAHAVVEARLTKVTAFATRTGVSGMAVRWSTP